MGKTRRNELCPCESGLKYKYCHGDVRKKQLARDAANKAMAKLINEERYIRGFICKHGRPVDQHCKDCKVEG